jgi:hypothetical protein
MSRMTLTPRRTMAGPGRDEQVRLLASNGADSKTLLDAMKFGQEQVNNFDPTIFQHAAEIAQKNLAMQEESKQANLQRQMQMQQLQMQERQANARGTLDHQRFKADDRNRQKQIQLEDRDSQQRFGLARLQESKRMGDQEQLDAKWQMNAAEMLDQDAAEMLKAARAIDYTPEGRRAYAQLAAEGKAIKAAKGKLRPEQYSQMLGAWMEKFEGADLGSFAAEPPTIKDALARNYQDIGNGMGAFLQADGTVKVLKTTDGQGFSALSKLNEDGKPQIVDPKQRAQELWGGTKNASAFSKAYKEAENALKEQWLSKPGNEEKLSAPDMSPAEVRKKMMETLEQQYQFELEMSGQSPAEDPAAMGQPGAEAPGDDLNLSPAGKAFRDRIRAEDQQGGDGKLSQYSGKVTMPGFMHDLKHQYSKMAGIFDPKAINTATKPGGDPTALPDVADPEAMESRAAADDKYFQQPQQSAIRELFEARLNEQSETNPKTSGGRALLDKVRADKRADSPFHQLNEAVKAAKLPSHPARYIDPRALARLDAVGSKDPVADAAASVATAIKEKGEHFALKSPMEQEALANMLTILDPKKDAEEIKKLRPGTYYMDPALRIYRVPPVKQSMVERVADPLGGKKFDPMMYRGIGP